MFAYLDRELVIFDTEFTEEGLFGGKPPELTEIAGIRVSSDLTIIDEYQSLIRPSDLSRWSEQHVRATGISTDDLSNAKPWKEVWKDWSKFTSCTGTRLAAWHAYTDYKVLVTAYQREKLGYPHNHFLLDVASMAYSIFSYLGVVPKNWELANVCTRLEIPYTKRHRAMEDSRATYNIMERLQNFEEYFLEGSQNDTGNTPRGPGSTISG